MFTAKRVNTSDRVVREALATLALDCFPKGELTLPTGSGWFANGVWWIIRDRRGAAVAFAGLRASVRWERTGYLALAGVLPEARGSGLQKRMTQLRLAECRRRGWKWAITDTLDNPASACSLIACGFRPYHPEVRWASKYSTYWRRNV
jgi:hypothetical protein